jgi:protein O-mannosyl-transferase
LAYINTLPNAFVFDDEPWILDNPRIRSLANVGEMLTATNRPVLDLTLALNFAVGGENPVGYHLVNLSIHVLAALVLYGLVRRTLLLPRFNGRFKDSAPWLSGAAAMLWLLHPLNTQSVTYVIQRGESLMGLLYLLTLYAFLRFSTGGATGKISGGASGGTSGGRKRWGVIAVVACVVGMGCKEVMATAPLVVLLYDLTFIANSWREPFARRWGLYLGLFAAWIPLAVLVSRGLTGEDASAGFALEDKLLSRWTYLLSQPQVIVEVYLRKAFWPNPLVLDYGWVPAVPQDTPPGEVTRLFVSNVLWQGLSLVGLLAVSVFGVVRRTWWGFLGISFFLILAPTSSFMPIADLAVEHRMYLPLIPVVLCVVFAGYALLCRGVPGKAGAYGLTLVAVFAMALGLTTVARNFEYRSKVTLWDSVVVARPNNARGWHNLGSALEDLGRHDDAMICYERVLKIVPNYAAAHYGIGAIWLERGDTAKAIEHFAEAARLDPTDAASHAQLGKALMLSMQFDRAEASLKKAIEVDSAYGKSYEYLGLLYLAKNDVSRAIASFRAGIQADPDLPANYQNLAEVLSNTGRPDEAAALTDRVIRRADEMGLSPEALRGFMDRRDRYRAQAAQAPAGL